MTDIADIIRYNLERLEDNNQLTPANMKIELSALQTAVRKLKAEGVNMWNYKTQLPKVFDVVEGSFSLMESVLDYLEEKEKNV